MLTATDYLMRPLKIWARNKTADSITLRQQIAYGDNAGLTDPAAANLNGQVYQHYDESGLTVCLTYDIKANLTRKFR